MCHSRRECCCSSHLYRLSKPEALLRFNQLRGPSADPHSESSLDKPDSPYTGIKIIYVCDCAAVAWWQKRAHHPTQSGFH
eukprot:7376598-Prymnesium_polylepis.1